MNSLSSDVFPEINPFIKLRMEGIIWIASIKGSRTEHALGSGGQPQLVVLVLANWFQLLVPSPTQLPGYWLVVVLTLSASPSQPQ
ncbi:hypothetical protein F2Q69_00037204 [Brassica cretica]|uniref:Uncharacterized protein n=1 Tax=Brassica cretica TaxID=69181 RepID=A0A8S9SG36_BRACR|nr:hypothetical protein F2Q69_00037204 [Brassica cretica]